MSIHSGPSGRSGPTPLAKSRRFFGRSPRCKSFLLPLNTAPPLKTYSPTPDYLPPRHCRICHHDGGGGPLDRYGLTSELARHVREVHGLEPSAYRRQALRQIAAAWPTEMTAQVLRSCTTGYRQRLTDANFKAGVCACCAREEQRCELLRVFFPPVDEKHAPEWLGWDDDKWQVCLFTELLRLGGMKGRLLPTRLLLQIMSCHLFWLRSRAQLHSSYVLAAYISFLLFLECLFYGRLPLLMVGNFGYGLEFISLVRLLI